MVCFFYIFFIRVEVVFFILVLLFFFLLQVVLRNSCYLFIFIKGESDLYTRTCAQPQLYICEIKICSNKTYFQHTTIFKTMLVIYVKNVLQKFNRGINCCVLLFFFLYRICIVSFVDLYKKQKQPLVIRVE